MVKLRLDIHGWFLVFHQVYLPFVSPVYREWDVPQSTNPEIGRLQKLPDMLQDLIWALSELSRFCIPFVGIMPTLSIARLCLRKGCDIYRTDRQKIQNSVCE